jgi:hypothetical protein
MRGRQRLRDTLASNEEYFEGMRKKLELRACLQLQRNWRHAQLRKRGTPSMQMVLADLDNRIQAARKIQRASRLRAERKLLGPSRSLAHGIGHLLVEMGVIAVPEAAPKKPPTPPPPKPSPTRVRRRQNVPTKRGFDSSQPPRVPRAPPPRERSRPAAPHRAAKQQAVRGTPSPRRQAAQA